MPEHEAVPYPPMTTLRGAVPGYPLTWVDTPDAARATLRAEAETSVLDPVGLRRWWWWDLHFLLLLVVFLLTIGVIVEHVRGDQQLPFWWLVLMPLVVVVNASDTYVTSFVTRSVPPDGVVPRLGPTRWRWYRRLHREPVELAPPAAWPAGSEAYAVLASAASVESVAPAWLTERVGLPPAAGAQWLAELRRRGWLVGGGRVLGLPRLPELHVKVTEAGRQVLEAERARLRALARR